MNKLITISLVLFAGVLNAETVVDVSGVGTAKFSVSVNVANSAFARCLAKNLELSSLFKVEPNGSIKVTGASGAIKADGMGKVVNCRETFTDDKSARMAARKLSDAMCEAYGQQKGFACDRVVFLNRANAKGGQATAGELCVSYPDGYDIRQLTSDGKTAIFPRWKNKDVLYYIAYLNGAPQIWELNTATSQRKMKWSFKGSPTGIAISPDGSKVAAILSFQGNPELYVIQGERWTRLTNTPLASEGQPTWSPDGNSIAYVSNESRHPQIYVINVATKAKRRLTSRGRENVDPDWGKDGRIAYITKSAGSQLAVMTSADGDKSAEIIDAPGSWEHPSWSRDGRHLIANSGKALFVVDTLKGGDKPRQVFSANGNWISPTWSK